MQSKMHYHARKIDFQLSDYISLYIYSGYYYKSIKHSSTVGDPQSMIRGLSKVEGLLIGTRRAIKAYCCRSGLSLAKVFVSRSASRASTNPVPCGLKRSQFSGKRIVSIAGARFYSGQVATQAANLFAKMPRCGRNGTSQATSLLAQSPMRTLRCGGKFRPRRTDARYCSLACKQAAYRERTSYFPSCTHSEVKSEANEQARNQFRYSPTRSDED